MPSDLFELYPEDSRLTTFPILRPQLWQYYVDAYHDFWTVDEIDMKQDAQDFNMKLTASEQHFVKHVLAFFAASDGIVNMNLAKRFKEDVPMLEAQYFYDYQIMAENIHAHTYSLLLDTIITSAIEKKFLMDQLNGLPAIKLITDYMFRAINSDESFAKRLLMFACVEGIFFAGCFCAIYWLQNRGLMPALGQSNELISRDEGQHTMFALMLYTMLRNEHKLKDDEIHAIFIEAVGIAMAFIRDALPNPMIGMNAALMSEYIKLQADNLLTLIDCPIIYGAKSEFHFMDQLNMKNRTNFFERKVTNYSKVMAAPDTADSGYSTDF